MEIRVGLVGHIVVDSDVDTLDVDTATKDVGGDTDAGLELLELPVTLDTVGSQSQSQPCEFLQNTYRSSWPIPE
jgi:hypothetical protein